MWVSWRHREDIELNLTNDQIKNLSKNELKKIVKSKTRVAALKYMTKLKGSKETETISNIKYKKLQPMGYMTNPLFSQDKSSLLMKVITRYLTVIRNDFGGMYTTKNFPMKTNCKDIDSLQHLLECQTILEALGTNIVAWQK